MNELMVNTTAEEVIRQPQQAPKQKKPEALTNVFGNIEQFEAAQRMANLLAASDYVPDSYKKNPANCTIAIDVASRMGTSPLMVMQNLFIVRGKPGWSGQACKALIDGCGKYETSEYVYVGQRNTDSWGCYLQAVEKKTGRTVIGATVTIGMAKAEGWVNKTGSKWQTMPELMLAYRAATFFARTHCPSTLMGFQTAEEINDVYSEEMKSKSVNINDI